MKNLVEKVVKDINSKNSIEWNNDNQRATVVIGEKSKKFIDGNLDVLSENHFQFNIKDTNYSKNYLTHKLRNVTKSSEVNFFKNALKENIFFIEVKAGDSIWVILKSSELGLAEGSPLLLQGGREYFKLNGGPLHAAAIGFLSKDTPTTFIKLEFLSSGSGATALNYGKFEIK